MKVDAIVYTSNTGYTRRYAEMLGEKTGLPVFDLEGGDLPARGAKILYMGWLMAGSVRGLSKAKKQWNVQGLCAVGMSPADGGQAETLRKKCPCPKVFYLQGGYDHSRLTGMPRRMMDVLNGVMKLRPNDPAGAFIVETVAHGGDWVSEEQAEPVAAWLNS